MWPYASIGDRLIPHVCMELEGYYNPLLERFQRSMAWRFILGICWQLVHLLISIIHIGLHLIRVVQYCTISSGILGKYRVLHLDRLRCLAIVVDSEEAKNTAKIKQLLLWLSGIGVNRVILYDMEGVLKKSMSNSGTTRCFDTDKKVLHEGGITMELLSFIDGRDGAARAASILCSKYLKGASEGFGKMGRIFTEADMASALKEVGCGGPEPDLLLIFGPARCHLGFPSWRLRYTEIVHMGLLKSLRHGAIVKAIHDFSKTHQNYGS